MQLQRLASPKSAMWAGRLEMQEELLLPFKSKGCLLQNSLLLGGDQAFGLVGPSTDYTRPTHTREGSLLLQISTSLNVI